MSKTKSIWNRGDSLLLEEHLTKRNLGRLFFLFSNLALNRFKWEGLPQGLESRHIERALFEYGQCAFVDDEEVGLLCLPCTPTNNYNVYGEPTSVTAIGIGYSKTFNCKDIVRIVNNDSCTPTSYHVDYYVHKISEIDKAMQKNLRQQKRPHIIGTTKQNELSMKNLMKKINDDEDEIYIDEKMSNGGNVGVEVLNTNAPYLIDKYQQHKNDLMCEFLTIMGLNNSSANNSKKERLLVDEVNVNNGEILMYLDIDYKNRLKACEEINKKFGLNVTVTKNIENLSTNFLGSEKEGKEKKKWLGIQ